MAMARSNKVIFGFGCGFTLTGTRPSLCQRRIPTTEMKSINWTYLEELDMLVVTQAVNACERMNLQPIMSFNCHWNEEVVAQFNPLSIVTELERSFIGCSKASVSLSHTINLPISSVFLLKILEGPRSMMRMCLKTGRCISCMIVFMGK